MKKFPKLRDLFMSKGRDPSDPVPVVGTVLGEGGFESALIGRPLEVARPRQGEAVQWVCAQRGAIKGATDAKFTPSADLDGCDIWCVVKGRETKAQSASHCVVFAAPKAIGTPELELFDQATGWAELDLKPFFQGENLRYSVFGAGIEVNPETGIAMVPTGSVLPLQKVVAQVVNSGGSAQIEFDVVIEASEFVEDVCFGAATEAGCGGLVAPPAAKRILDDGGSGLVLASGRVAMGGTKVQSGTVIFDDGTEWEVMSVANEVTVDADGAVARAVARAPQGGVVRLRGDLRNAEINLSNIAARNVSLIGEPGHSIRRMVMNEVTGLTLSGLNFVHDNSNGAAFKPSDAAYVLVVNQGSDVKIEACKFDCDPRQNGGKQAIQPLLRRFGAIRSARSKIEVAKCRFIRVRDGVVANFANAYIHGCHFEQIVEDAITGQSTDWVVDDNFATLFEGTSVRQFPARPSGTLTPGTLMRQDGGGKVIEVVRFSGGILQARINNYDLPSQGERYVAANGASVVLSGKGKEARGLNIHGDFFQPLLLKNATRDHQLIARRNVVVRSIAPTQGAINQEPNTQGILAQRNGGNRFHAPVEITHNIIATGQAIGIRATQCGDGIISNNNVIWAEMGLRSDLEIRGCRNLRVERNVGDSNQRTAVDDKGGNRNVTFSSNVYVNGRNGDQKRAYSNPFKYPQTRAGFAPVPGGAIDVARAGALKPDGSFR